MKHSAIKDYYQLIKPGIVYGNAFTAAAGLLFASAGSFNIWHILTTLIFICFVMAGACAVNNAMDIDIDSKMSRTKKRPTVTGRTTKNQALVFGWSLSILGLLLLLITTNALTFALGCIALLTYAPIYTVLKKKNWIATWVGAVPGALPPVAGYTAITNQLDGTAVFIFMTMFVWQMAHFYGIALFRREEYKKAGVPIVSIIRGQDYTQKMILAYVVSYLILIPIFYLYGGVGIIFAVVMVVASFWWLKQGLNLYPKLKPEEWGLKMFLASLKVLMIYSLALALTGLLP